MRFAFRREDDDAHREPKFELPIPPGPNLVTARGLALTEARVAALEAALAAAPEEGREAIARDLRYWRTRLATAELAPLPPAEEPRWTLDDAADNADIVVLLVDHNAFRTQKLVSGIEAKLVDTRGLWRGSAIVSRPRSEGKQLE